MSDLIDHPPHYNQGKIEVIDFIEDQGLSHGFCLGNAIKYITRAGAKDGVDPVVDLEKAVWYLKREIEIIKAERKPVRPNATSSRSESFFATSVSISNPIEAPTGAATNVLDSGSKAYPKADEEPLTTSQEDFHATYAPSSPPSDVASGEVKNVFDNRSNTVYITRSWIKKAFDYLTKSGGFAGFVFPIEDILSNRIPLGSGIAFDSPKPPKAEMRKVDFNFKGHWTEVNTTDQESYVVFLPQGEFSDLAHLIDSDAEVMGVLIPDGLECPKCSRSWAGNSEQAESIRLKGECLGCLTKLPDPLAEPIIPPSNW